MEWYRREQTGREERAGIMNGMVQDCRREQKWREERAGIMNGMIQEFRREQTGREERADCRRKQTGIE
jgi:hypothetical protein